MINLLLTDTGKSEAKASHDATAGRGRTNRAGPGLSLFVDDPSIHIVNPDGEDRRHHDGKDTRVLFDLPRGVVSILSLGNLLTDEVERPMVNALYCSTVNPPLSSQLLAMTVRRNTRTSLGAIIDG